MNIDVPLEPICDRLESLEERLAVREAAASLTQEWYTLRQAARLKRGVEIRPSSKTGQFKTFDSFYNTLRHRPELQPNGGIPDGEVGGMSVWHRMTVQRWLNQLDGELGSSFADYRAEMQNQVRELQSERDVALHARNAWRTAALISGAAGILAVVVAATVPLWYPLIERLRPDR